MAVEPNGEMLKELRAKPFVSEVEIFKERAEELGAAREVEVALAKSVLHHFGEPDRALENMARIATIAVGIVEVVLPDERCRGYVTELVCRKEP